MITAERQSWAEIKARVIRNTLTGALFRGFAFSKDAFGSITTVDWSPVRDDGVQLAAVYLQEVPELTIKTLTDLQEPFEVVILEEPRKLLSRGQLAVKLLGDH